MVLKVSPASLHWSQPSVHLFCPYVHKSVLFYRCRSHGNRSSRIRVIGRALTASFDSFSEQDFSRTDIDSISGCDDKFFERDELIIANKANSSGIPLSLRIMKRKKQRQQGFLEEVEDSACCSVKRAFSSMVFIISELHSYTLRMREMLFFEDLQGILASVEKEMHASFVWLFQKVFSHTPTLMMYLMILLANYSVYSMSTKAALAANVEQVYLVEDKNHCDRKFDSWNVRTLILTSSNGNTASVGGDNNVGGGGGGKYRPIGSGTDGDGMINEPNYGVSSISSTRLSGEEETLRNSNSPVNSKIEIDRHSEHLKTEEFYLTELAREPNDPLLLANYAQFLYIVTRDFDRAEEYFKRATMVEPKDAEALNKYANFMWVVKTDLWAAEEAYLEAITAEPESSFYSASYAHFLWSTGAEDTCFPLTSPDSECVDV